MTYDFPTHYFHCWSIKKKATWLLCKKKIYFICLRILNRNISLCVKLKCYMSEVLQII